MAKLTKILKIHKINLILQIWQTWQNLAKLSNLPKLGKIDKILVKLLIFCEIFSELENHCQIRFFCQIFSFSWLWSFLTHKIFLQSFVIIQVKKNDAWRPSKHYFLLIHKQISMNAWKVSTGMFRVSHLGVSHLGPHLRVLKIY